MARSFPSIAEFAAAAGAGISEVPLKEGWRLLQAWREIYCAPFHETTGKWATANGCAWHTFSGGFFPSIAGGRALIEYQARGSGDLLVLPESDRYAAIRCTSSVPVDFSPLRLDIYVAPSSFEWTMVFTHQYPEYGPYFARAEWGQGFL